MCNVFDVLLPNTKWYKMWSKCVSHVLIMSCLFNYSVSNIIQTWFLHSSTAGWARNCPDKVLKCLESTSGLSGCTFDCCLLCPAQNHTNWLTSGFFWRTMSPAVHEFRRAQILALQFSTSSVPLAMVWFMDGPKDWPVGAFWWSASWAKDDKARTASSFFFGLVCTAFV